MDARRPLTAAELFDAIGAGYEDAFGRPPVVDRAVRELLAAAAAGVRGCSTSAAGRAARWRTTWPRPGTG